MATISAMMQSTSLLYKASSKGLSIGGLNNMSQLTSLLGNAGKQTGINYAGYDYFDTILGKKNTLNNMISEYDSGKSTFKTEFKAAMNTAKSTSSSLKSVDYQNKSATEKVSSQASAASDSLSKLVNNSSRLSDAKKSELTSGISAFKQYAASPKSVGSSAAAQAKNAVSAVKSAVEEETGLNAESAKSANEAATKAAADAKHYAESGSGIAKTISNGVDSISSYLNYFEKTGKFEADASRMGAVLNTIQSEVTRSVDFQNSVQSVGNFVNSYNTDDETQESLAGSLGTLQNFAEGFGAIDETSAENISDGIAAISRFLTEGADASEETVAAAKEAVTVLKDFADTYESATALGVNDAKALSESAANIQAAAQEANKPFEDIAALENFGANYQEAEKSAFTNAKNTAQEIEKLIKNYNETVNYLNDNVGLSTRFDSFANSFNDSKYFSKSLESIGISVKSSGELSVDTDTLTKALQTNPNSVERILGQDGLAGRLDKKVSMSDYQADKMFPAINSYLGGSVESTRSMYSSKLAIASMMYNNVGSFMDMYI